MRILRSKPMLFPFSLSVPFCRLELMTAHRTSAGLKQHNSLMFGMYQKWPSGANRWINVLGWFKLTAAWQNGYTILVLK